MPKLIDIDLYDLWFEKGGGGTWKWRRNFWRWRKPKEENCGVLTAWRASVENIVPDSDECGEKEENSVHFVTEGFGVVS